MADARDGSLGLWAAAAAFLHTALDFVLLGAAFVAAIFASRLAALVMLGAVAAQAGIHTLAGVLIYRRTMSRPWPHVPPIRDDDEE